MVEGMGPVPEKLGVSPLQLNTPLQLHATGAGSCERMKKVKDAPHAEGSRKCGAMSETPEKSVRSADKGLLFAAFDQGELLEECGVLLRAKDLG